MTDLTKGILIGVGAGAVGFCLYKANEKRVDSFLNRHGVPVQSNKGLDLDRMTLEDLMEVKESIEDKIAEFTFDKDDTIITCHSEKAEAEA